MYGHRLLKNQFNFRL